MLCVSCTRTTGTDIISAVILVLLSCSITYLACRISEKKRLSAFNDLQQKYKSALEEKDKLTNVINQSALIDEPIRNLLSSRISILDELLVSLVFDKDSYSSEKATALIESIAADKETYMNTLGLIFSIKHPLVAEHFKKCGLNTWEIGYCSFYCIGYKGKEIGNLMGSSKYYKVNSSIRKKLGMGPKDTNIDIHLRKVMNDIECNNCKA